MRLTTYLDTFLGSGINNSKTFPIGFSLKRVQYFQKIIVVYPDLLDGCMIVFTSPIDTIAKVNAGSKKPLVFTDASKGGFVGHESYSGGTCHSRLGLFVEKAKIICLFSVQCLIKSGTSYQTGRSKIEQVYILLASVWICTGGSLFCKIGKAIQGDMILSSNSSKVHLTTRRSR